MAPKGNKVGGGSVEFCMMLTGIICMEKRKYLENKKGLNYTFVKLMFQFVLVK